MSLWAIVPVKPLKIGKSRLTNALSDSERFNLNTLLFQNTLNVLQKVDQISNILVVSRDSDVLAYSRSIGVRTVQENGIPELNDALRRASIFSQMFGATSVLIVPADLPLLEAKDIYSVINNASEPPCGVIVPDRRREGTNTILISPPDIIPFSFGIDSFSTHCMLFQNAHANLKVLDLESIALDLDTPEDLTFLENNYKMINFQGYQQIDLTRNKGENN